MSLRIVEVSVDQNPDAPGHVGVVTLSGTVEDAREVGGLLYQPVALTREGETPKPAPVADPAPTMVCCDEEDPRVEDAKREADEAIWDAELALTGARPRADMTVVTERLLSACKAIREVVGG